MCTHTGIFSLLFVPLSFFSKFPFVREYFFGELAQLARASALQAEGQGFEPPILQYSGQ